MATFTHCIACGWFLLACRGLENGVHVCSGDSWAESGDLGLGNLNLHKTKLSTYVFFSVVVFIFFCLSVCMSCRSASAPACLSVYLSVCLSVYLAV